MNLSHSLSIALLSAFLLTGCIREPEVSSGKAVIDGWIDSDGYPVVVFTASLQPDNREQKVADKMIQWGKVTVSDGQQTEILTGKLDKAFFPPYRYYSFAIKGEPGKTYTMTADYEEFHATARCTMPYPTPIDSISIKPIEESDSLRSATLYFTAPADCPAFYYLTVRSDSPGARPLPAMMGTVKATQPGASMSVPVFNAKNQLDTVPFVPQLKVGQNLEVKLCRVSEEVYDFWSSYENSVMFGGSQFIAAPSGDSSRGNIEGGYGVWSVQGVDRAYIEVR